MVKNRVKKFNDFITNRKRSSKFNRIHIEGELKSSFFSSTKPFEIIVYFTAIKNYIFDIYTEGVELDNKKLGINFNLGDHIDIAKKWVIDNNYKITYERKK